MTKTVEKYKSSKVRVLFAVRFGLSERAMKSDFPRDVQGNHYLRP